MNFNHSQLQSYILSKNLNPPSYNHAISIVPPPPPFLLLPPSSFPPLLPPSCLPPASRLLPSFLPPFSLLPTPCAWALAWIPQKHHSNTDRRAIDLHMMFSVWSVYFIRCNCYNYVDSFFIYSYTVHLAVVCGFDFMSLCVF